VKRKIASFIIPVLLLFFIFMLNGFYPVGDKSLLAHDMKLQYFSFFSFMQNNLQDLSSFFYSFEKTNGHMASLVRILLN